MADFSLRSVLIPVIVVLTTTLSACGGGDASGGGSSNNATTTTSTTTVDTEDASQSGHGSYNTHNDSASDNSKGTNSTTTVAGTLRVITTEDGFKKLTLNDKVILKDDYPILDVEQLYKFAEADVALIHADLGGKMTAVYYLVVLTRNKQLEIEDVSLSDGGEVDVDVGRDSLTIDLGYDGENHRVATYMNGQVKISSEKVQANTAADDQDCEWLYNDIYLAYIQDDSNCANDDIEPKDVGGMATERPYNALSSDPRLDLHTLDSLALQSCKSKSKITYPEFQKKVCIAH